MDDTTEQIVEQLKVFKQQGLNYYQATQKLQEQGFTNEQISIASSSFPYTDVSSPAIDNSSNDNQVPVIKSVPDDMSSSEEDLGNALLKDKQETLLNSRFFIYVCVFIVGFVLGAALMRYYLIPQWFSPASNIFTRSPSYLNSRDLHLQYIYPGEAGIAGGFLLTIIYGLYSMLTNNSED